MNGSRHSNGRSGLDPEFDYAEALRRVEGESGLLREIADVFVQDYPATLTDIRRALARKDRDALIFSAHKMKGALATLSAGPSQAAALRLEQAGTTADWEQASDAVHALEQRLDALVPALRAIRADDTP